MEQDIIKKIDHLESLIEENIAITKENEKKIKKVQAYMRRTFIAKILYWILIVAVTAGAVYAVRPYVKKTIETYESVQEKVGKTSDILDNPGRLFKDVGILNQVFEFFSQKDIIAPDKES